MCNPIKVKFITKHPFPYGMAPTNRIINYCKGLMGAGVNVEVYCIQPTYREPTKNRSAGLYKRIPFRYANSCQRSKSFVKRRIYDFLDFLRTCKDIIIDNGTDVNFIFFNSFFKEFILVILSRLTKKKVVRELCEYPYYKDCFMGDVTLKYLFPFYNGFITISENLFRLAHKHKSTTAEIIKVPILLDKTEIETVNPYQHNKPYIFHGGKLTESKDAMVSTIKAFAIANRTLNGSVDFIIAGPPSEDLSEIKRIIKDEKLEQNVIFLGEIPHDKVLEYVTGASLCILNKNNTLQNQCGFSTKLSDILLAGTPVITTYIGEAPNWLKDNESAYITEPHRPDLIANLIVDVFSNESKRKQIANMGKIIALENFDISTQGPRLAEFFKGCII